MGGVGAIRGWALIKFFTIFSRAFSVSPFSIDKTKNKEHCFNFIPSTYNIFEWVWEGWGLFEAGCLLNFPPYSAAHFQ